MSIRLFAVSDLAVLFASAGCGQSDTGGTPGGATGGAAGSAIDAGSDSATGGASGSATDAAADSATDGAADSATDGATDSGALGCVDITSDCNCLGSCPAACGALTECSSCSAFEMPAGIETYFKGLAAATEGGGWHILTLRASAVQRGGRFQRRWYGRLRWMYHYTVGIAVAVGSWSWSSSTRMAQASNTFATRTSAESSTVSSARTWSPNPPAQFRATARARRCSTLESWRIE